MISPENITTLNTIRIEALTESILSDVPVRIAIRQRLVQAGLDSLFTLKSVTVDIQVDRLPVTVIFEHIETEATVTFMAYLQA